MTKPPNLLSPSALRSVLDQARQRKGGLVPAVLVSSERCPWCDLVIKEQLRPRIISDDKPELMVLHFDIADRQPVAELFGRRPASSRPLSPSEWSKQLRFAAVPTVVCIDRDGNPLGEPLIGYSSRDFYAAYLEDRILLAQAYWRKL